MGLKTKVAMAMGTAAAGAAMVVGGSFALFTDEKSVSADTFTAGTVKLNVSNGFTRTDGGTFALDNMAPGDTVTLSFDVQNSGSLDEWVDLETTTHNLSTDKDGKTIGLFSSFDTSVDAGTNNHGLDQQVASGSGDVSFYDSTDFNADKHPATWTYTVVDSSSKANLLGSAVSPSSADDWTYNHPFILRAGETATVTYTVTLPLAAHNDYQGLSSSIQAEVDAVQARNNFYTDGTGTTYGTGDIPAGAQIGKEAGKYWPRSWQPDHEK